MPLAKDETLLRGEDFVRDGEYKSFTVEIETAERCTREGQDGKSRDGILFRFKGAKKPFFAPDDKLNQRLIRCELGTLDPAKMVGKSLTLIPVMGNWFGIENGLAIRVAIGKGKPRPQITKKMFGTPVNGVKVGD